MSAAVILAAGAGRRLGQVAKATLALPDGRSFLEAARDIGRAAGVRHWVVVCGPPHERVTRAEAERLGLATVHNPRPERGMASSVAVGFEYALERFAGPLHTNDCALLWPVDHVHVQTATVSLILGHADARRAIIPVYRDPADHGRADHGRGGHPTAFGRAIWSDLALCAEAPQGARSVLRGLERAESNGSGASASRVLRLEVTDPGVLADVDTPRQLARLSSRVE